MCGIVGWLGRGELPDITTAIASIAHRGPDARGEARLEAGEGALLLGHARLSVVDLSEGGAQPMFDASRSVAVVFNGEIYNHLELRAELARSGTVFRSTSDTEVLVEGYRRWGRDLVHRLRGMFAFGLWDARDRSLWLVRDRLGIKPLFYAPVAGGVAFASEIKALFALGVSRAVAPGAVDRFLTYLYVPGPMTAFREVSELLPGHQMLVRPDAGLVPERYWSVPAVSSEKLDEREVVTELRAELETVLDQHAMADVPLGAFLSGGLDSSTIVGLMQRRSSKPLRTFCMTFGQDASLYDERLYAREVAAWFGTEHTEIEVEPRLVEVLPRIFRHFDQPFGNPTALLSYELSRLTRAHVTVALAGDGGDELFLGYPRYAGMALAAATESAPAVIKRGGEALAPLIRESMRGRHTYRRVREFLSTTLLPAERRYQRWISYFEDHERARLLADSDRASPSPEEYLHALFRSAAAGGDAERSAAVDLVSFLPNNVLAYGDRMSMAHGLELRVPYCDHVLVEKVARLPARLRMKRFEMKRLLRAAVRDLLPPRVLRRAKLGFNPPMGLWITRELAPLVDRYLSPAAVKRLGVLRPEGVALFLDELRSGHRDVSLHVWSLLVVQAWLDSLG